MKISVVIPLYNKVRHIQRTIDSVIAQSYTDFELIVVDDGSTDGGGEVVRTFADKRIILINQENAGECAARNRGIKESSSDLVAFLDADDEWRPCFLEMVVALFRKYGGAGMYATAYVLSKGETLKRPIFTTHINNPEGGLLENYFQSALPAPVTSSSVMIPKRVLEEVGGFPVGIRTGGDTCTWTRIALRYRVAWSPVECAVYHLSADNRACALNLVTADMASARAVEEFIRSGKSPVIPMQSVNEYLAGARIPMALNCHLNGRRDWALELLRKTKGTSQYRWKRVAVCAMVCIPSKVLIVALKFKALFRKMSVRFAFKAKGNIC